MQQLGFFQYQNKLTALLQFKVPFKLQHTKSCCKKNIFSFGSVVQMDATDLFFFLQLKMDEIEMVLFGNKEKGKFGFYLL